MTDQDNNDVVADLLDDESLLGKEFFDRGDVTTRAPATMEDLLGGEDLLGPEFFEQGEVGDTLTRTFALIPRIGEAGALIDAASKATLGPVWTIKWSHAQQKYVDVWSRRT